MFVSDEVASICVAPVCPWFRAPRDVIPPLLGVRHEPLNSIHPPFMMTPFAKVEVAAVPVSDRYVAEIPPANVEVAFVSPLIVVVAVPPTATYVFAERAVEEAFVMERRAGIDRVTSPVLAEAVI